MKKIIKKISKPLPSHPGQVLILFAVAMVVLLLFIGLVIDLGRTFIRYSELRRATDAAVLAAAAQIREMRTYNELAAVARETMDLNGVSPDAITVETCANAIIPNDPELCTTPPRKLVRITSEATVQMAFMQLIGFHEIGVSADAIGEAASMDVVLVIDISESMSWDAPTDDPKRDPKKCNSPADFCVDCTPPASPPNDVFTLAEINDDAIPGECQPFEEVKKSAANFATKVLNKDASLEEDRLAIVTFANGWSGNPDEGTAVRTTGWTSNLTTTLDIIYNDLKVFEPGDCVDSSCNHQTSYGACRLINHACIGNPGYPEGAYIPDLYCLSCNVSGEYSSKTSTNIGGGMLLAGNMFNLNSRTDSLWVVVLLTDGMANATDMDDNDDMLDLLTYPIGYCPTDTVFPFCQDEDVSTRHITGTAEFDADDYARMMSDFVGCFPINQAAACGSQQGQGAIIFTIGLGNGVLDSTNEVNNKPYGAELLRYIAAVGYDGDPATDPCEDETDYTEWCGNYYYSPSGDQLVRVFEDIASRIFTRITH